MFGSENINRKERTDSQYHCDRNISRHIRPTGKEWDQSHYIVDKDEKKRCQQIWSEFPIIGTDTTLDDIIVHHHNKHLHESDESSRCQRSARTFAIPVGYTQYNHQQQHTVEQQSKCHLCDRKDLYKRQLLLFILGVSIGSNSLIVNNLGKFGKQAIILAISGVLGSLIAARLVLQLFFKKGGEQ